ncbi:hypothetical protein INT48_005596 [Thamnidium elegans]|uniref:Uncharacterized protein n=1 Tax=Thamnidium elegans TaxID=101142 RepID=A0A8H7VY30_9FUNG|nr:hypothetical protein INT48_005596 [Thamnidium elegans]
MTNVSLFYKHYLDLRKMRQDRLKRLQQYQKTVQKHEQSLFRIRNHLAKALTEQAKVNATLKRLSDSNVWVTAQEHAKMHHVFEVVKKEYDSWIQIKQRKHEAIAKVAQDAKLQASHIIGIERALICLEDQMRSLLICPKQRSVIPVETEHTLFLRRSTSNYSIRSILKDASTSLAGTLLNKWFKPGPKP